MKRILWFIFCVLIGGYALHSYQEKAIRQEAKRIEAERHTAGIRRAYLDLLSGTNAVTNWEERLSKGESYRLEPILTIELEKIWMQLHPIAFVGVIRDIATHDNSTYRIRLEKRLFGSWKYMFDTELELSLLCEKEKIDTLLEDHPNIFDEFNFENGVAVIAQITSIESNTMLGPEGEKMDIRVGKGQLLDLVFVGDVEI